MKDLKRYIQEKLVINKNYNQYTASPTTFVELRKIIEQRYKKNGSGTEQNPIDFNDIDVSGINSLGVYSGSPDGVGIFERIEFEYIDISDWDVSNVKDISYMFYKCENLKSIGDLSKWDVSKVKNMEGVFYHCYKLESVGDLSKWNVSGVKNMVGMFSNCKKLKSVGDLSNWNVSNVKHMTHMFHNSGITNIPFISQA